MYYNGCQGCIETGGKPFGGECITYNYVKQCGAAGLGSFKQKLIDQINALSIPGLVVTALFYLPGSYVSE